MVRIASATGVPWATRTSTWRSLATISSGLCLFLDMDPSSFGSEAILQGGPLQRGRIKRRVERAGIDPGGQPSNDLGTAPRGIASRSIGVLGRKPAQDPGPVEVVVHQRV